MKRVARVRFAGLLVAAVTVSGWLACDARDPLEPVADTPAATKGTSATTTTTTTPATDPAEIQTEMLARWNRVADMSRSGFDFHWVGIDQFPHPTFKGGSVEAYQGFAQVLLGFFQADDDFDFLGRNHLFEVRLRNVFPSGQVGIDTSFRELARYFSASTSYGNIPEGTRASLGDFAVRMEP